MAAAPSRQQDRALPKPASAEAGFSLTEVLVTLSIAAFASAMVIATARPADPLKQESERLAQLLEQLESRARISGEPTGLVLEAEGYTGAAWTAAGWDTLPRTARTLTGVAVVQPPSRLQRAESPAPEPQIVFDPLGHSVLVPIQLRAGTREMAVPLPQAPP